MTDEHPKILLWFIKSNISHEFLVKYIGGIYFMQDMKIPATM